jgi:hypothetical protein
MSPVTPQGLAFGFAGAGLAKRLQGALNLIA